MIKAFKDITDKELAFCGGKAKNLIKMLNYGINVPNGFVISYDALNTKNLEKKVLDVFDSIFTNKEICAIRSSALFEDGSSYSWSGIFESYLNIPRNDIGKYIKMCTLSLNSERAIKYSEFTGILNNKMAVIVQKMVKPVFSGISYSHNPITGDSEQIIEYTEGFGDKLASGYAKPKRCIFKNFDIENEIEKTNLELEKTIIIEILQNLNKLTQLFNKPVDIEWSFDGNYVYILQCREITTIIKEH